VIATGGFPANQAMRNALMQSGQTSYSAAPTGGTGDGIRLAQAAGAALGTKPPTSGFWTPTSKVRRSDGSVYHFPHLVTDRSRAGVIAVNLAGERFVNEAYNYHDFGIAMLDQPARADGARAFLICDARYLRSNTFGIVYPGAERRMVARGYLIEAPDAPSLARKLGVDEAGLAKTLERFNASAREGLDPDFGKGTTLYNRWLGDPEHKPNPCLAPIEAAPLYAIPLYPGDIGTSHGLETDEFGRVLKLDKTTIPGLFACGNDLNSIMAGEYPAAGITLGPALTFGYVVARFLANSNAPQSAAPGAGA
jgi:succinate dehydrogenase/fumarate reductase flavoprotein subunit